MADLNKESMAIWKSLKPMIDEEIKAQTRGSVQRRKMKVTTAPSLVTNVIGVTEPYGTEMLIPFTTNLSAANVGDVVWVEFMYGATNAFASMYASADTKDWTVGGVLDVVQRRCSATLSSAGWYRVLDVSPLTSAMAQGALGESIRFDISRRGSSVDAETHTIVYRAVNGGKGGFTDESSKGGSLLIDKIRYTRTSTSAHIDIHYNSSGSNGVTVYFDVNVVPDTQYRFTANSLTSVADAPSGETVLTTHNFSANASPVQTANVSSVLRSGTFTPSDTTLDYTATAPCWFFGSLGMQANSRGTAYIEVNNVRIYDFGLSASLGHQYCFVPVPLQKGDRLYVYISSNDNSTYKIIAMR